MEADRSELLYLTGVALLMIGTIILIVSYAHGGVSQARDLKHLLELEIAKRDFAANIDHIDETVESTVASDLRDNFISDI